MSTAKKSPIGWLNSIRELTSMGSSMQTILKLLTSIPNTPDIKALREQVLALWKDKTNIVAIQHYVHHFLINLDASQQPPLVQDILEVFQKRWSDVYEKVAQQTIKELDVKKEIRLLIYGVDPYVEQVIEQLLHAGKKVYLTVVFVPEDIAVIKDFLARYAKRIPSKDIVLLDLWSLPSLPSQDVFIIGTSLITKDFFVAKKGSGLVLMAAIRDSIPVYILGDSRKLFNAKYMPKNITDAVLGLKEISTAVLDKFPKGIRKILNYNTYEKNTMDTGTCYVLENGSYSAETIQAQIDKVLFVNFL